MLFPVNLRAQETYLVAYAGFAGFHAPVWAPKDLGLFQKYAFNGDVVLVPGSVRQVQAVLGSSLHLAQIDAAMGINAINQGATKAFSMNWTARDFSNDCSEKAEHERAMNSRFLPSDSCKTSMGSLQFKQALGFD